MNLEHRIIIEQLSRNHMEDVIILLQYISEYYPPPDSNDNIWMTYQSQPNVHAIVASDNYKVVGFGSLTIETKIRGGKMGHIEDIVSHPNYRNEGLGRIIMESLYEIARHNNCYKLALQCNENNIEFYEKCEYIVSGAAMQRFI